MSGKLKRDFDLPDKHLVEALLQKSPAKSDLPLLQIILLLHEDPNSSAEFLSQQVNRSVSTVWRLMARLRDQNFAKGLLKAQSSISPISDDFTTPILDLINGIPLHQDLEQWCIEFRSRIRRFVPGNPSIVLALDLEALHPNSNRVITPAFLQYCSRSCVDTNTAKGAASTSSKFFIWNKQHSSIRYLSNPNFPRNSVVQKSSQVVVELIKDTKQQIVGELILIFEEDEAIPRSKAKTYLQAVSAFLAQCCLNAVQWFNTQSPEKYEGYNCLRDFSIDHALSERETEIFYHYVFGWNHKTIAELLFLSPSTVSHHISAIHQKTGSTSVGDLFQKILGPNTGFATLRSSMQRRAWRNSLRTHDIARWKHE